MGIAAPSSILHSTLTRMALKTWVILCLVLLSITLTLSSSHEENNSIVRKSRPRKGSDYEIESAKQKPRHGVGSKHGKKDTKEMTILGMMIWICSLVWMLMITKIGICSLVWKPMIIILMIVCFQVWRPNDENLIKNVNLS